jgi:hypothetical protein
MIRNV